MNQYLTMTVTDGVAYLTLNRPKQGNAINLEMAQGLLQAAIQCDQDPSITLVVLSGAGRFFCTGGDIGAFEQAEHHIPMYLSELAGTLHLAISRLMRMAKVLLVLVNGSAAGAGMSLALIGDLVIADRDASFSPAYGAIGLSPDAGLSWQLSKLLGLRQAQKILMLNQSLTAEEAEQLGLITEAVSGDNLAQRCQSLIQQLSSSALPALANIKQLLLTSHQSSLETHLELEARAIASISLSEPATQRISAFLQQRRAASHKDHQS